MKPRIVLDTNVIICAMKSRKGASYKLLSIIDSHKFEPSVSVPLVLEYESILKRETKTNNNDIEAIIDYICKVSGKYQIYYLWRPYLKDPKDDMVLELAVASQSQIIVTYNRNDYKGVEHFGIKILSPKEFLKQIGEIS
jgi:putative PIN family toxin of toxin-antitoxin system